MKPLAEYETCAFCPRLCRPVCPVAMGSAREAATPTAMMLGPFLYAVDAMGADEAAAYASLCTSCGACAEFCHVHRPVAELLRAARETLAPAATPAVLGPVVGEGALVAIECDGRPWADALARHLKKPVARLVSTDHLGEALLDHPHAFAPLASALRARLEGRTAVVADLGCLRAAEAAGLTVVHLATLASPSGEGPVFHACHGPRLDGPTVPDALGCCGAAAPLSVRHPEIAAEVAETAAARLAGTAVRTADARCGAALRKGGAAVHDPVTALLENSKV